MTASYPTPDTHPDKAGLALPVLLNGVKIGTLHCFRPDWRRPELAWYGMNAARTASGQAHGTRQEAAADVVDWHEGRQPHYTKYAIVPRPRPWYRRGWEALLGRRHYSEEELQAK